MSFMEDEKAPGGCCLPRTYMSMRIVRAEALRKEVPPGRRLKTKKKKKGSSVIIIYFVNK